MTRSDLVSIRLVILRALGISAGAASVAACSTVYVEPDDGSGGAGASADTATTGTKGNSAQSSTAQTANAATTTGATATASVTSTSSGGVNACGEYTSVSVEPPTEGTCAPYWHPFAQYVCYPPVPEG